MLRTALDRLYLWAGYAAGLCMVGILLLMMGLSLGREIGVNIKAGDDIVAWLMAAMAFLGLAHTFRSGEMIRVGLLIDRFTGRTRHAIEIFSLVVGSAFICFFAWHAVWMTVQSWQFGDMAQGALAIPLWIPQIAYSGGILILAIAMLDELVHVLAGGMPRYEKPKPTTAEEVIEQAIQSAV